MLAGLLLKLSGYGLLGVFVLSTSFAFNYIFFQFLFESLKVFFLYFRRPINNTIFAVLVYIRLRAGCSLNHRY
jgi:hypothetical protein